MAASRRVVIEFLGDDRSASKVAKNLDTKTSKLGDTFKRVGKLAALGLGVGLAAAGAAAVDFTKAAMEDEASAARLAQGLRNATGATKDDIAAVEDWITKRSLATGVADDELRPAFQRLAEATGDTTKAMDLLTLAQDVSAGTGKSLEAVSTAMMKAQNGNVGALSRLGIKTKDAAGNTLSLKDATKEMADTFGGQASKKAETMQGKMDRLKVLFNETKEEIGYKLIPIVVKMADVFLKDVVPALQRAAEWFSDHVIPVIKDLWAVGKRIFNQLSSYIREHMDDIKNTISDVVTVVRELWGRFGDNIMRVVKVAWNTVKSQIQGAFKVIRGIFKIFSGVLKGDWGKVWSGIKDVLKGAWQSIKSIVKLGWTLIKEAFRAAGGVLRDVMGNIWDGIKSKASDGLSWLVEKIKQLPGKLRDAAGSAFKSAGKFLIDSFVNGMKNAAGIISGIAGNVWDTVKDLLNGAIDRINSALEFKIDLPGPDIHINTPDIPHLARGTSNFRGGLALVGENGPELALLPRGSKVMSNRRSRQMTAGGENITITAPLVIQVEGKTLVQAILKFKRTNGNVELGIA